MSLARIMDWFNRHRTRIFQAMAGFMLGLLGLIAVMTTEVVPTQAGNPLPAPSRTPTARPSGVSKSSNATPASTMFARSPASVQGQPQVDANTILLYHFDSPSNVAVDATGNYTGTLVGNATTGAPMLYAGTLSLGGSNSYVRVDNLAGATLPSQGTIDAYVDFQQICYGTSGYAQFPIANILDGSGNVIASLRTEGYIIFDMLTPSGWQVAISGINPCRYLADAETASVNLWLSTQPYGPLLPKWPYEAWRFHHVAGTWGPRGVEVWVDGVLHGVGLDNITPIANWDNYNWGSNVPYWCNPQEQIWSQNLYYPICTAPVAGVVPTRGYNGNLTAHNSIVIGCDPNGLCINTRLDEFRFSNVQRSFSISVDPTLTPTPTQTPDSIQGAYSVDSNTRALYHFDTAGGSLVLDATGTYTGYLSGNAQMVSSGRFGGSLQVNATASWDGYMPYARLGNLGDPGVGTLEAWFKSTNTNAPFTLIHGGDEFGNPTTRFFLGVWPTLGTLRFGVFDGTDMHWADSGIAGSRYGDNCWHHAAGTWGPQGMQIWVDGILRGTNVFTGTAQNQIADYFIGCNSTGVCFNGNIDEVRMSTVQHSFSPYMLSPVSRSFPGITNAPLSGSNNNFLPLVIHAPPTCTFGP